MALKMTPETYDRLDDAIGALDTGTPRDAYRNGRFPRADTVQDLDKRYRWDLFWAAGGWRLLGDEDLNDSHIDSALRAIVSPL